MRNITFEIMRSFQDYLISEEKAAATVGKYLHDVESFRSWLGKRELCKSSVLDYKVHICAKYAPASVNTMLTSLNVFFCFIQRYELKVKNLKIQRKVFAVKDTELTKTEYGRLLQAAKDKNNERLYLLMQTICSTGIRVSEVQFITVEALGRGMAEIHCKGKQRTVFLPRQLCRILTGYVKAKKIKSGCVFVTKNGKPLDRSNIWSDMKKLCAGANVSPRKVFPHNLRHLFARTYYSMQKDIVRLADILGHSNVNTTRIYTTETGEIHRRQIQKLGLLRC